MFKMKLHYSFKRKEKLKGKQLIIEEENKRLRESEKLAQDLNNKLQVKV